MNTLLRLGGSFVGTFVLMMVSLVVMSCAKQNEKKEVAAAEEILKASSFYRGLQAAQFDNTDSKVDQNLSESGVLSRGSGQGATVGLDGQPTDVGTLSRGTNSGA